MASPTFDVPKKDAKSCSGYLNAFDPAAADASFRNESGARFFRPPAKTQTPQQFRSRSQVLSSGGPAVSHSVSGISV